MESSKQPGSPAIFRYCALAMISMLLVSVWFYSGALFRVGTVQTAWADSPEGRPTNTPKPTKTPTPIPTNTPTITLTPTNTPSSQLSLPIVIKQATSEPAGPKPVPPTVIPTQAPEAPSLPAFWIYIFVLFAISAAVVVLIIIGLVRAKKDNQGN